MSITSISFAPATEFVTSETKKDVFNLDLEFIHQTLLENHPGVFNSADHHFSEQLNKDFSITNQKLNQCTDGNRAPIVEEYIQGFHDQHLCVFYDQKEQTTEKGSTSKVEFGISDLKQSVQWITIPTFTPDEGQKTQLQQIIQEIPNLRNNQTIIFDLRGNYGGNSEWGAALLKALFGDEYVLQRLTQANQNTYVEWRASHDNLTYIQKFEKKLESEFEENTDIVQWIKKVSQGMEQAYHLGENYYIELPDSSPNALSKDLPNIVKAKIIAIIDHQCGSACLDFIDGLQAMNHPVTLVGERTGADTAYMEVRTVCLPSGKGTLSFPIKVYKNRPRGHNIPYSPDIKYEGNLMDTLSLKEFVSQSIAMKKAVAVEE